MSRWLPSAFAALLALTAPVASRAKDGCGEMDDCEARVQDFEPGTRRWFASQVREIAVMLSVEEGGPVVAGPSDVVYKDDFGRTINDGANAVAAARAALGPKGYEVRYEGAMTARAFLRREDWRKHVKPRVAVLYLSFENESIEKKRLFGKSKLFDRATVTPFLMYYRPATIDPMQVYRCGKTATNMDGDAGSLEFVRGLIAECLRRVPKSDRG
jgi:hypothetical protein